MRIGEFSAAIPEGRERDSGHVELAHGTIYTIQLANFDPHRRCDARVEVDGKEVGTFRLEQSGYPNSRGSIERPIHDTGRFTFYRSESVEACAVGEGKVPSLQRGLVVVTFLPEKLVEYGLKEVRETPTLISRRARRHPEPEEKTSGGIYTHPLDSSDAAKGIGAESLSRPSQQHTNSVPTSRTRPSPGVTGLSDSSSQRFRTVTALDYDPLLETQITLRLVCVELGPHELTPAPAHVTRGNVTPSPVV